MSVVGFLCLLIKACQCSILIFVIVSWKTGPHSVFLILISVFLTIYFFWIELLIPARISKVAESLRCVVSASEQSLLTFVISLNDCSMTFSLSIGENAVLKKTKTKTKNQ